MALTGINTYIQIGSLEVQRCPEVVVDMQRHRPVSLARIVLNDAPQEAFRSVSENDAVVIRLGYRGEAPLSWQGTVIRIDGVGDQVVIRAAGAGLALTRKMVCQSFYEETPEAIASFAIGQAGLPAGRIDSPGVVFPRFTASDIPAWQVVRQCEHTCQKAFGIDMSRWALWVGGDGKVNWGNFEEAGEMPVIATGAGLIRHLPGATAHPLCLNLVETFLLAGFRPSRRFRLIDTRRDIDDDFQALTVTHRVTGKTARTFIGYGEEVDKY